MPNVSPPEPSGASPEPHKAGLPPDDAPHERLRRRVAREAARLAVRCQDGAMALLALLLNDVRQGEVDAEATHLMRIYARAARLGRGEAKQTLVLYRVHNLGRATAGLAGGSLGQVNRVLGLVAKALCDLGRPTPAEAKEQGK